MTVIEALQQALAGAQGDLAKAWMAIERVRYLHKPCCGFDHPHESECDECGERYPCSTIRALDGNK